MRYRPAGKLSPYGQMIHRGFKQRGECLLAQVTLGTNGYRYVQRNRKVFYAHRVAFEIWIRKLEPGEQVDHVCHNEAAWRGECPGGKCYHRQCVNPSHLEAKSRAENMRASPYHGRNGSTGKIITHCPKGHEYTMENTRLLRGSKICKTCRRLEARAKYIPRGIWLTQDQVSSIQELHATGRYSLRALGRMFGVKHGTIKKKLLDCVNETN